MVMRFISCLFACRFRWLCSDFSTASRKNLRHLLRPISDFYYPLVYHRYVSRCMFSHSSYLIANAGVIVNLDSQFWFSSFTLFPFFSFFRSRLSCYDYWISSQVSLYCKHGEALFILMMLVQRFYKPWNLFQHRGLRSKRIKRIEHNLAINIKETHRKIWNGVTKDVGILRKVLNEVYFLKFKVRGMGYWGNRFINSDGQNTRQKALSFIMRSNFE